MHDGHKPEVREACRDRVSGRNYDISLNNVRGVVRGVRGSLMGRLTPFMSPCIILALWRYFSPSKASAS